MKTWRFREELIRTVNRWYWIFASLVIGGIAGYLIGYLIPAPYQATADLFVGIDVVRVNEMEYLIPLAKEEPLNLDDYKNWQLKQVSDILTSPNLIEKTLTELREMDPAWKDVSANQFYQGLDIYWYDTGTWRLRATFPDPELAEMAVKQWLAVGHQRLSELLEISETTALLDLELQSLNDAIATVQVQIAGLETFLTSSDEWVGTFDNLAAEDPIDSSTRADLLEWIDVYQVEGSTLQIDLSDLPEADQPVSAYLTWLKNEQTRAQVALEEYQTQTSFLKKQREDVLPLYHQSLDDSIGLSANLVLEPNDSRVAVTQVRSTGELALGGSVIGFLIWLLTLLFRVGRGGGEDE